MGRKKKILNDFLIEIGKVFNEAIKTSNLISPNASKRCFKSLLVIVTSPAIV